MALPILCYHQIGAAEHWGRRLNIEPSTLVSHIEFFRRRGWMFVRASDIDLALGRNVCFTFDDAFASAVDELGKLSKDWTASVYAVTSLVGSASSWDGPEARPLANWEALRALAKQGFEIGNHSHSHCRLGELDLDEQVEEWREARRALEAEGFSTHSCCLPYGSRNSHTAVAIAQAGYAVGLGLGRRPARLSDDMRLLPRIVVGYSDRLPRLIYKIWVRPWLPSLKHRADYVA